MATKRNKILLYKRAFFLVDPGKHCLTLNFYANQANLLLGVQNGELRKF